MRHWLWLVLFSLVLPISVRSQQPLVGLIEGTIVDRKLTPLRGALLTATNIDSVEPENHRRSTASDHKGFYQFVDIPMGRYAIIARKSGYRNYRVSEVTVRGGETVKLPRIIMSPVAGR